MALTGGMVQATSVLGVEDPRARFMGSGVMGGQGYLLPDEAEFRAPLPAEGELSGRSSTLQRPG